MSNGLISSLTLPFLVLAGPQDSSADEWAFLPELLEEVRVELGTPGMAIAVARGDEIITVAVSGVRVAGEEAPIEPGDRFHIGSVTKPMTSTLIAYLIEEGLLTPETTLGEALPEMEMLEVYRGVTLDMLLLHRGGVQPYATFTDEEDLRLQALPGSPSEQRAAFLAEALMAEPIAPPDTVMHYSNAGYGLAALMAEVATGKPWEELMQVHVWDPLGMTATGAGWPATPERPDQPLGHMEVDGELEPQPIGGWDVGVYLAPAGDVHASAADLARFGLLHAQGLAGLDSVLMADTVEWLHTAPEGRGLRYARGWMVTPGGDLHVGSAGSFFALLQVVPEFDASIAVLANSGDVANHAAAMKLVARVTEILDAGD